MKITDYRNTPPMEGPYFSLNEAALYLGVSPLTLRKVIIEGRIPHQRLGRRFLIAKEALDRWVTEGFSDRN